MDLRTLAHRYLQAGWHPFPLPARAKDPPPRGLTGSDGVDLTPTDIDAHSWDGNLGVRVPPDVVGIDVDAYHGGLDTLKNLTEKLCPLPNTYLSHSSRHDGSGIRFFRVPVGLRWVPGVPGIELVQRDYRYAVAWPSTHPEDRPYYWLDQAEPDVPQGVPLVEDLAELPWPWIAELSRATDDVSDVTKAVDLAGRTDWLVTHTQADAPGYFTEKVVGDFLAKWRAQYARHDAMQHDLTWAMECVGAGLVSGAQAVAELGAAWQQALAGEPARAALSDVHPTEFEAMLRHAIGKVRDRPDAWFHKLHDDIAGIPMVASGPPTLIAVYPSNLPDEFWQRPLLAAIRAYAHSRGRSADAVYAAVRARFTATVPWTLRVATGVGGEGLSLNSLIAIIGPSGAGKSSSVEVGASFTPITYDTVYVGPLGSGEGISEAFFELRPDPSHSGTGKAPLVKVKTKDAALFDLDEGEALSKLSARQGALVLTELRKGYSGSTLGQSNASTMTRRVLAAHAYRLVLLVGLQTEVAVQLLADADTGTPQRFVFFSATDPAIDRKPAALPVLPSPPPTITAGAHMMTLAPEVQAEVEAVDHAVQTKQLLLAPLDAHRPGNRIKEAAILALLDGRMVVDAEDWRLGGLVMDTSDAIRRSITDTATKAAERKATHTGTQQAVTEGAKERKLVADMADRIAEKVCAGPPEGIARGDLRGSMSSSTRHRFGAALDLAVRDGKVKVENKRVKVP
jgi:Arc/MetJ-type ribon-helix-helix transcriptional regulator